MNGKPSNRPASPTERPTEVSCMKLRNTLSRAVAMLPMMTVAAATLAPTVTIAPGVEMPALTANLYDSKANYLAAIKLGLRSFDVRAYVYSLPW